MLQAVSIHLWHLCKLFAFMCFEVPFQNKTSLKLENPEDLYARVFSLFFSWVSYMNIHFSV
jgi:hypothetical protein